MGGRPIHVLNVITSSQRRGAEFDGVALDGELRKRDVRSETVALMPARHGLSMNVPVLGARLMTMSTVSRLRRRASGADVVVAHGSRTLPACALALAGTSIPFVYKNIGDTVFWSRTVGRRLRVRAALRRADLVVALTPSARLSVIRHHRLSENRVVVIPNWRSGTRFQPLDDSARREARRALSVSATGPMAVVVGALSPEKRVDLAIEAAASVPGLTLVVVGEGPERAALERRARLRLPDRHHFTGSVDDPERLIAAADVLLLSSESEGVPGVLIEAGLCGLPAVAFDVGGVRSVVEDGVTGRVVPFGDTAAMAAAVTRCLDQREELGTAARGRYLADYDTDRVVDLWLETLRGVALRRNPGSSLASLRAGREA